MSAVAIDGLRGCGKHPSDAIVVELLERRETI